MCVYMCVCMCVYIYIYVCVCVCVLRMCCGPVFTDTNGRGARSPGGTDNRYQLKAWT